MLADATCPGRNRAAWKRAIKAKKKQAASRQNAANVQLPVAMPGLSMSNTPVPHFLERALDIAS